MEERHTGTVQLASILFSKTSSVMNSNLLLELAIPIPKVRQRGECTNFPKI
jgi:hypothetical protein